MRKLIFLRLPINPIIRKIKHKKNVNTLLLFSRITRKEKRGRKKSIALYVVIIYFIEMYNVSFTQKSLI